ncbi:uncharacterized protein BO66DRAFT_411186 [Aspergillus aculeatinus CBS 121060]|uniref:Uncharacterized protein n=1 Tax=Aspergillus aculeatinus CBS 121060 TaxID=1448322 RepID=A0ACD1HAV2_9EURO|nr:hypothetical protein BO66DRAFT_411186 [Aspergillus aculeatinus CBS 121060]RAH70524.1 hypothetical protein BO66DRAFT_411186 [Aspergillus aculeatinus CBS 121060]
MSMTRGAAARVTEQHTLYLNKPSDVEFFEKLRKSKYSVFLTSYYDKDPSELDPSNHKINLYILKFTVYRGMNSKGLWKRRVIPNFSRIITKYPARCLGDLHMFNDDRLKPNAVRVEYVPNLQPIDLSNSSERRLAKVLHGDSKPRNMMASLEDYERILWMDFNPALIFSDHDLSPRQERWIADEVEMIDY